MLDILFLSYDEPNADENFERLKRKFPHAKRVHGVRGIANAHLAAAERSHTSCFYVVDGDAEIYDSFKFDYKPEEWDQQYVHIWHAYNPATGQDYGYGGVKLFSKKLFKNIKTALDFSTTLAKDIKIHPEIACTTRFNSDAFRSYRGAFREAVKLYSTTKGSGSTEVKREARERLASWLDPVLLCSFRDFIVAGAQDGIAEAKRREKSTSDLLYINDHDLMKRSFESRYSEIDFNVSPIPPENHPMRHELFFTTRIASALYDQFVLTKLPMTELRDAISDGQLLSKTWVIDELNKLIEIGKIQATMENPAEVAILGGWIGTLALMMNAWELPLRVTSIDLDERANRIAEKFNYDYDFKTQTLDMYTVDYTQYDIIVNTSSEHIPDIAEWRKHIPDNKVLIIQNNNFEEGAGHISCVKNVEQLRKLLKLREVYYEGTRSFPQYNRFMLIGTT